MVTVKPDYGGLSPIVFYLDRGSGVPTYLQFVHQVDYALRLGFLREGDQLPRIKDVARTLAVNPDTVMKAYRELELRGVAAEMSQVSEVFTRLALSQLSLHLTLRHNNKPVYEVPASAGLLDRIGLFFGADLRKGLYMVEAERAGLTLAAVALTF